MLDGVLFFPLTPFDDDDRVELDVLRDHLEAGIAFAPGGIFVACGTGEFHALAPDEFAAVVATAVEVTAGRVPVFVGVGGAVALARRLARVAADAGADGVLLLPPYLVTGSADGLVAYVSAVAGETGLPLIVYHRGNARFTEESAVRVAALETVVGLKDGVGDLDLMSRIVTAVRDSLDAEGKPFQFFNGMPTAEASQAAYRAIGVELYSSATFAFAPAIAVAFNRALTQGDQLLADALRREFFFPIVRLRDRVPGYAVALVKAGAQISGIRAGHVRPPLVDLTAEHRAELGAIIDAGLRVLREHGIPTETPVSAP